MKIQEFYDKVTATLTYLVWEQKTNEALIIDPVLDYNHASGKFSNSSITKICEHISKNSLKLNYILETHAHADHISGAKSLKQHYPNAKIGISKNITLVQETFKPVFNLVDLKTNGEQFDLLFDEKTSIMLGDLEVKFIATPGHTPACYSFLVGDNVFTGDALFMPDFGTGRCDFPKGSAKDLYNSIHFKLFNLPDSTNVYVGHDYMPGGRELAFKTTIGESKKDNIQIKETTSEEQFIDFRTSRDLKLNAPKLLLPSIQINIDAGNLPPCETNGISYIRIPLTES